MDKFSEDVMAHCVECTAAENQTCRIVENLLILNKLLRGSMRELRERPGASGQLHLEDTTQTGPTIQNFDTLQLPEYPELLGTLLKSHHCISSAQIKPSLDNYTGRAILEALRHNSGLKSLCLILHEAWAMDAACEVIPCLTSVVDLQCNFTRSEPIPQVVVDALLQLLQKSSSLETLRLIGFPLRAPEADTFFTALSRRCWLRELSLNMNLLEPEHCPHALIEYLTTTAFLKVLFVILSNKSLQAAFLEGISNNKSLEKLILVGFRGDEEATGIVAGLISSNKVLRSLTIWTLDYIQPGIASVYDCWIPALIENETLEKLDIPYQIFEPPQWARLFQALLSKENLNVHIQDWVDRHPDLSFLCAKLKSGGLKEKVSIGYYDFQHEIEFLQCKAFSEVHFSWQNDRTVAALRVLPSCRHITSINLRINRGNVAVSSAFAEFLKSTTALRKLNLSTGLVSPLETDDDTRWWSLLHKALRRNGSLRDLSVTLYGMSVQEMEELADSIGRSTSIRWVHIEPQPITNASAFVRRFSKDIERNHTLLTLICEGHIDAVVAEHWYVVQETTRRNSGVVARAARLQKAALLDR
ncbi:hypothetical protein MRX96_049584 [Rhipicephalus microplus]